MGCLFCGKTIGPLRLLRDSEFCRSDHRRQYKHRLGRALDLIGEATPSPQASASVIPIWPEQPGTTCGPRAQSEFDHNGSNLLKAPALRLDIFPVRRTAPAAKDPRLIGHSADLSNQFFETLKPIADWHFPSLPAASQPAFELPSALPYLVFHAAGPSNALSFGAAFGAASTALPKLSINPRLDALAARPVRTDLSPVKVTTAPATGAPPQFSGSAPNPIFSTERGPILPSATRVAQPQLDLHHPPAASVQLPFLVSGATGFPRVAEPEEPAVATEGPAFAMKRAGTPLLSLTAATDPHALPAQLVERLLDASMALPIEAPVLTRLPEFLLAEFTEPLGAPAPVLVADAAALGAPARPAAMAASVPVESLPLTGVPVLPLTANPRLALPMLPMPPAPTGEGLFDCGAVVAAVPHYMSPPAGLDRFDLAPVIPLAMPESADPTLLTGLPRVGFARSEFLCWPGTAAAMPRLGWLRRDVATIPPQFLLQPALEPAVSQAQMRVSARPTAFDEIPSGRRPIMSISSLVRRLAKPLAACLVVGAVLWFGASAVRVGNDTPAVHRDATAATANLTQPSTSGAPRFRARSDGEVGSAPPLGPVERFRRAISDRAAVQITDTFRGGMQAWGASSKALVPGWSHHPDGFVRPGQLAVFRPSTSYTDYRLEFFGQIEAKSMGWAVRARDSANYYGMKFTIIEPGLRPVIAMVHYTVVAGKRSHRVEVPLNVMVHNNTPYHVAVEVKGNRIVTSLEGQEVDSWIDDTLPKGGVGFFADAGERARLYWMKISKNEDFLGRVCAYLSGSSSSAGRTTADLWPAGVPQPIPPQEGSLYSTQMALAVFQFPRRGVMPEISPTTQRRLPSWSL